MSLALAAFLFAPATDPPRIPEIPALEAPTGSRRIPARSPAQPVESPTGPAAGSDDAPVDPNPVPKTAAEVAEDDGGLRRVFVGSMFGQSDEIPRVVGSAHSIDETTLEHGEHDDVHKILAEVPGVYVRGEDGFGLRPNIGLRGANSDRSAKVTLLEDGILMAPAPYSAPAAYYFPLTTRMVGVEVFKGPAAIRHGPNTIGGAINLRSRAIPEFSMGHVDLAGGRFGYGKAHGYWGTRTPRGLGVLIEAARVQSTGFKRIDGPAADRSTGFGKDDASIKVGYRTPGSGPTHAVEVRGGFTDELSNETYLGLSDADFAADPWRRYAGSALGRMRWWRTDAQAGYQYTDRELELEARAYRHDFRRAWRKLNGFRNGPALGAILSNPDAGQSAVFHSILRGEEDTTSSDQALLVGTNDRRYVSQGTQAAFRWRPQWERVANELEVGVRAHNDFIDRSHTEEALWMTDGALIPEAGGTIVTTTESRGSAIAAAFHLYDALTIADRLTIAPGVRVELITTNFTDALVSDADSVRRFDAIPVPGIGAHLRATKWLDVFAGAHRGFSPVAPGQPDQVRPEFSLNYELGTRVAWEGLHAEATGFFSDYANLTGQCTFSAGCDDTMVGQQFNAGRVWVYGLESIAGYEHRFDSGFRLGAGARYTYTGNRFRTAFDSGFVQFGSVEIGDALPYVPLHVAGANAAVGGTIWHLQATLSHNGAMRDVAGQGVIPDAERVDAFTVLDLAAEVDVWAQVRLYANANNVTNARYMASRRPFGARPGAPLTVMVGVKLDFFGRTDSP